MPQKKKINQSTRSNGNRTVSELKKFVGSREFEDVVNKLIRDGISQNLPHQALDQTKMVSDGARKEVTNAKPVNSQELLEHYYKNNHHLHDQVDRLTAVVNRLSKFPQPPLKEKEGEIGCFTEAVQACNRDYTTNLNLLSDLLTTLEQFI